MSTSSVMDYDPNLVLCGRMVRQTVKLVFADWKYRAEMTVEVRGNIRGFDVVESAVENAYEQLRGEADFASITLVDADGNEILCEDDEEKEEDWLKDMLISAEVVAIVPLERSGAAPSENQGGTHAY